MKADMLNDCIEWCNRDLSGQQLTQVQSTGGACLVNQMYRSNPLDHTLVHSTIWIFLTKLIILYGGISSENVYLSNSWVSEIIYFKIIIWR